MKRPSPPSPPAAPRIDAGAPSGPPTALADDALVEELRAEDARLGGTRVRGLSLVDAELRRCDLANLDARGSAMTRVQLTGCRLTGLGWVEGTLRDVRLRDCVIDLASLRFTTLERVVFEDCVLRDADLQGVRGASVVFHDCDLSGASLDHARFQRSELRRCTLEDLLGVEGLRGIAMPWSDVVSLAGAFAAALGVRLLDDEEA